MRLKIPGPAGQLEAKINEPAGTQRAVVVLAHPHPKYGGTMCHKVVFRVAKALQNIGCTVLRFNFRGTGASEGRFDGKDGEHADFFASLDFAATRHPKLDLWAAGFSFGAWVALTAGALDSRVRALIGVAPPIERYDFDTLQRSEKPKFFIQGKEDQICPLEAMRRFYAHADEPKELVVMSGADYLFDDQVSEVGNTIEDLLANFPTYINR